jgi:hypothetical protein
MELDLVRRRATRLGKPIDLRPKEFLLLEYLVRNVNRPVTRTMILEHVWNSSFEGLTNVVDVYISSLRSKVDRDFPQKLIQTNRGIGYTFTCVSGFPRPGQIPARRFCGHGSGRGAAGSIGGGAKKDSIVQNHIEQRFMNPDATVVFNKAELAKAIHEEADA